MTRYYIPSIAKNVYWQYVIFFFFVTTFLVRITYLVKVLSFLPKDDEFCSGGILMKIFFHILHNYIELQFISYDHKAANKLRKNTVNTNFINFNLKFFVLKLFKILEIITKW